MNRNPCVDAPDDGLGAPNKLHIASDLADQLATQIMIASTPDEIADHPDIQRLWEVALMLEEADVPIPLSVQTVLCQVHAIRAGQVPQPLH